MYDLDPNLTPAQRRRAIRAKHREIIRAIFRDNLKHALGKVADLPDEWDGHEIREWIAEDAAGQRTHLMRNDRARAKAFRNVCATRNLTR